MRVQQTKLKLRSAPPARRRAAALIIALVLALCLTMLVVATQLATLSQLKSEKGQRDYDRALELAEAGANAYLNYLAARNGTSITPWNVAAPPNIDGTVLSTSQIRKDILAGNIKRYDGTSDSTASNTVNGMVYPNTMGLVSYPAQATLATRPALNSQFGYFVTLKGTPGFTIDIVSYGYANGIVRRVQVGGSSASIFDWAAIYVLDNNAGDTAWAQNGSASTVGGIGGEGNINWGSGTIFDGPVILAANGNTFNTSDPTVMASTSTNPAGNQGTHAIASPSVRRLTRSLNIETADTAANNWSGGSTGVEYFRNNNDNATGFRFLLQNNTTHLIYELSSQVPNVGTGDLTMLSPSNGNVPNGYSYYGLRVYPGSYFFESVQQKPNDTFTYYRTFNDADRNDSSISSARLFTVSGTIDKQGAITAGEPANPNTSAGASANRNIRYWIGQTKNGANISTSGTRTQWEHGNAMEYPAYASRFRIYDANPGEVDVNGSNSVSFIWNVNLLAYNFDSRVNSGAPYGNVKFTSSTYVRGSLIAWQVTQSGSTIIEKQATEGGTSNTDDKLVYQVTSWKELP